MTKAEALEFARAWNGCDYLDQAKEATGHGRPFATADKLRVLGVDLKHLIPRPANALTEAEVEEINSELGSEAVTLVIEETFQEMRPAVTGLEEAEDSDLVQKLKDSLAPAPAGPEVSS